MAGGDRRRADPVLIEAMLAGRTDRQAAADAGVSESTVARRRRDPQFMAQLTAARAARYERLTDRTSEVMAAVISRLSQYLLDDATDPYMGMTPNGFHARRLQATHQLISVFFDARAAARDDELVQLREQLELLEREVGVLRELVFPGEGADGRRESAPAD